MPNEEGGQIKVSTAAEEPAASAAASEDNPTSES
jgi:hypothetical protein